ncbi:MAG: hypothetical protein COB36_07720 [Alphaproteobacteria bacterium]|nr:MAG: hypothetical protein COB36_07720 [Alphaproteobacteria bacterium]
MSLYIRQYFRVISFVAMFSFVLCLGTVVFAGAGQDTSQEPQFFSSLQDIPLMSGIDELADHAVSFDKPDGRISESFALIHDLKPEDVLRFYSATLPQLGWGQVSEYRFFRQSETLEISFGEIEGQPIIRIMIGPTL